MIDKKLLADIFGILGWSSVGYVAYTVVGQGLKVIGNMFYGPILNAALGVGEQMQGTISQFRTNFQTAINPQITKSYFAQDYARMENLMNASARYSFYVLWVILLPLSLQLHTVLHLWLGKYPPYTIELSYILFFMAIIASFVNPFSVAITSIGKLSGFTLVTSAVSFCSIPLSYCILKECDNRLVPWMVYSLCATINLVINIYRVKRYASYRIITLLKSVLAPIIGVVAVSSALAYCILRCVDIANEMMSLIVLSAIVVFVTFVVIYAIGLNREEKHFVMKIIKSKIIRNE